MKRCLLTLMIGMAVLTSTTAQSWLPYKSWSFHHANDINFYTDCYFTAGFDLGWSSPVLRHAYINHFLPGIKHGRAVYTLSLTYNLYTPKNIYTEDILPNDHPYAAYFLLGLTKTSYLPAKRLIMTSSFGLGMMGPIAGGEQLQNGLHDRISFADHTEGWQNQIRNDVCIRYAAALEYGLMNLRHLELNSLILFELGVPQTRAVTGLQLKTGLFEHSWTGPVNYSLMNWQVFADAGVHFNIVRYNGVLEGGFFNQHNTHVLYNVNPGFWNFNYGLTLVHRGIIIRYGVQINSPEFAVARWHHWSEITIAMTF